jgi:hypothetical protein
MDILWIVIFGVLGTGALLFCSLFIFLLNTDPRSILQMNEPSYHGVQPRMTWASRVNCGLLVFLGIVLCIAMYHVSYTFLGWMPDDWGKYEDGEWITARVSLSGVFSMYAGGFLYVAIGRGVKERVRAEELEVNLYLRDRIDSASYSVESLINLLKELEADDMRYEFERKFYDYKLPPSVVEEINDRAITIIGDQIRWLERAADRK